MRSSTYSSIDPSNGNVIWNGPLSVEKGNHAGMPARTEAYLPCDERGHVNASSLGGKNTPSNVVAQHRDLNHGAYLSMENGERHALQNGASIDSEKIAVVDAQPGDRPTTFMVNDAVTYADGHTEPIHHSFTNESNVDQIAWNGIASSLPGTYDAPNPGDELRESMSSVEYSELMETTDAGLSDLTGDYASAMSDNGLGDGSELDDGNDPGGGSGLDDGDGLDDGMDL